LTQLPAAPLLLTPGPLSTHPAVREAMLRDHGSRDPAFTAMNQRIRDQLVALVAPGDPTWTCVPVQGSGTFGVEAALGSLVPLNGELLVVSNGAYGRRLVEIARQLEIPVRVVKAPEDEHPDPNEVARVLGRHGSITHVAMVQCETTTGLLNPVGAIAAVVARHGRRLIVDAMSALGALPLLAADTPALEAVVASSNKCLEGAPGVAFCITRVSTLREAAGQARSLSLDLSAQWARFNQDGQWRFTPPTHVLAALDVALRLHAEEGGVAGRGARYADNCRVLVEGLRGLGFQTLLPDALQAPIIVTFLEPGHAGWDFDAFYDALAARGFLIYPGKLTERPSFRVGCIGQVFPDDLRRFVAATKDVLVQMGLPDGAPSPSIGAAP
jgi:2-aminoethylphosphonate-pyruvate transaminase